MVDPYNPPVTPYLAAARARVVDAALAWVGTPYHHQGRVQGVGADCVQLLLAVYHTAGIIPFLDVRDYSPDWMFHRSDEVYLGGVNQWCDPVRGEPAPGDVLLYRFGRCFSHAAIVADWPRIIHAYRPEGGVVLGIADGGALYGREMQAWRPRGLSA